jgi:hypothetical protein
MKLQLKNNKMSNFKKDELSKLIKRVNEKNIRVYFIGRKVRLLFDQPIQGHYEFEIEFYRNRDSIIQSEMIENLFATPFYELPKSCYLNYNDRKMKVFKVSIFSIEEGERSFISSSFQKPFIDELTSRVKRYESLKDTKYLAYKDNVTLISDEIDVSYTVSQGEKFSATVEQPKEIEIG